MVQPSHSGKPDPSIGIRVTRFDPWFYSLLAGFLLMILFGIRLINDSDLGFHLKSGQWILENLRFPTLNTYTYNVPDHEYLDMEWLYQIALFLEYRLGGYSLLSLSHVALAVLAFTLLWIRLRGTQTRYGMSVLLFTAAFLASEPRFRVRPEILSWVLLGLTLWILESRLNRGRDLLFLLPLIQWFWVNTEGLFFIGLGLMGFYCLTGIVHLKKTDNKLLKYSALAAAACLLNPYFIHGFLFPFSFLSSLGSSEIFKYTVHEFQPPWSFHNDPRAPTPWYLVVYKGFSFFLLAGLLVAFRKTKIHEWLLVLFFFILSASAIRNIPLFVLACAPLAAAGWGRLEWAWLRKFQDTLLSKPLAAWALTLFLLGFSARVVTNAHYVSNHLTDRFGLGLDQEAQPARACRFLVDNHLNGKIINDLDSGDWLDWQGPQKTFIDGRLDVMGREFFTEYTESQLPGGLNPLLAKYRPDILFFNPLLVPQWALDLPNNPDWRLVYLDSVAAVYLWKGYAEQIPNLDDRRLLEGNGLSKSNPPDVRALLQLPPPSLWTRYGEGFVHDSDYPNGLLNLGIFCGNSGRPDLAELFFLEAIRRTGGRYYDFYYNLGLLYYYEGRHDEAALCMKRVLRDKPDDPGARQVLGNPSNL